MGLLSCLLKPSVQEQHDQPSSTQWSSAALSAARQVTETRAQAPATVESALRPLQQPPAGAVLPADKEEACPFSPHSVQGSSGLGSSAVLATATIHLLNRAPMQELLFQAVSKELARYSSSELLGGAGRSGPGQVEDRAGHSAGPSPLLRPGSGSVTAPRSTSKGQLLLGPESEASGLKSPRVWPWAPKRPSLNLSQCSNHRNQQAPAVNDAAAATAAAGGSARRAGAAAAPAFGRASDAGGLSHLRRPSSPGHSMKAAPASLVQARTRGASGLLQRGQTSPSLGEKQQRHPSAASAPLARLPHARKSLSYQELSAALQHQESKAAARGSATQVGSTNAMDRAMACAGPSRQSDAEQSMDLFLVHSLRMALEVAAEMGEVEVPAGLPLPDPAPPALTTLMARALPEEQLHEEEEADGEPQDDQGLELELAAAAGSLYSTGPVPAQAVSEVGEWLLRSPTQPLPELV